MADGDLSPGVAGALGAGSVDQTELERLVGGLNLDPASRQFVGTLGGAQRAEEGAFPGLSQLLSPGGPTGPVAALAAGPTGGGPGGVGAGSVGATGAGGVGPAAGGSSPVADLLGPVTALPGFADLNATPQEQNLLQLQAGAPAGGGGGPFATTVPSGGGFYQVPLGQFPRYGSQAEATSRYAALSDWLDEQRKREQSQAGTV